MLRVALQARPLLGVLDEEPHATRDGIGGGLRTADEGVGHHLGVELLVGEAPAPLGDGGVHQIGEQAVVGLAAQPLEDRLEVVLRLDLHLGRPDHLIGCLHQAESLHPRVGPGLDAPDVVGVGAHLHADHHERERDGELADDVARAVGEEVVDQFVGEVLDGGLELGDLLGAEGVVEQGAHLAVLGVVTAGEGAAGHPTLLLVQGLDLRAHAAPAAVDEPLGVDEHRTDVLVARDHVPLQARVEPHRRVVAQGAVRVVRAVVDRGVEEVDPLDRHRLVETG